MKNLKNDFRIKELFSVIRFIEKEVCKLMPLIQTPDKLEKQDAVKTGLDLSKRVCAQIETVFVTPAMKNLLVIFGDVKQTFDEKSQEWSTEKLACGAKSNAVEWVNKVVNACLVKYNGQETHEYNTSLGIFDPQHHNVDCWNAWKPEIFDIQPGQAEARAKLFLEYGESKTNYSYEQLLEDLSRDPYMQLASILFLSTYPEVCADKTVKDYVDPFTHKHSGTSYPDYHNDGTRISKDSDMTYGKKWVELVQQHYRQGLSHFVKWLIYYLVYTGYPRNQRGSGRALEANSRPYNIGINIINGPEMENYKTFNVGVGLRNEESVKKDLIKIGEFCESLGPEYAPYNLDATKWDKNLGYGLLAWQCGLRYMKTNGTTGKQLVILRQLGNKRVPFVDGPNGKVHYIYGREMSGYVDTTLGNTNANRVLSIAAACSTQPDYSSKVYYPSKGMSNVALGDDLLVILKKTAKDAFAKYYDKKGVILHNDAKDAYGLFFIQYRLIKINGEYKMGYSWPRVLRSCLSKEEAKSLGPAGHTLAWYQQIGKCYEFDSDFMILTNLIAAFDKGHLSLDHSVQQLCDEVIKEDEVKRASQKGKNKPFLTSAERLSGGNPQALGVTEDGKLNANFFEKVQQKMKQVYNPHFLEDLGFAAPDLNKVH